MRYVRKFHGLIVLNISFMLKLKLGAPRLAVKLALDPEGRLEGNGQHLIFNFTKEIPLKMKDSKNQI